MHGAEVQVQTSNYKYKNGDQLHKVGDKPMNCPSNQKCNSVLYVGGRSAKACMTVNGIGSVSKQRSHPQLSLSSLIPPTSGYFSEDGHFTVKASRTICNCYWYNRGLDRKTPGKGDADTITRTVKELFDLGAQWWTPHFQEQWTLLYSSHINEWICNNLLIFGSRDITEKTGSFLWEISTC